MKKKIWIVGSIVVLVLAIAIFAIIMNINNDVEDDIPNGQDYFNAEVLAIYDDYIEVKCLNVTTEAITEGTQLSVTKNVQSKNAVPNMNVGDIIRVVFTGVMETNPPQIKTVWGIYAFDSTKAMKGNELYSFPEPTKQITGSFYSQGAENNFVIGSEQYNPDDLSVMPVIEWFYNLELTICEQPEDVEGGEHYSFDVNGETVFGYQDRGSNEAYIIVSNTWYKVKNPSTPPIDPSNYVSKEHTESDA